MRQTNLVCRFQTQQATEITESPRSLQTTSAPVLTGVAPSTVHTSTLARAGGPSTVPPYVSGPEELDSTDGGDLLGLNLVISSIATINPTAAAFAALAAIADSIENTTETKSPTFLTIDHQKKSPIHEPPPLSANTPSGVEATPTTSRSRTSPENSDRDEEPMSLNLPIRNKSTRLALPRSKKASDDWRRLGKSSGSPSSKKPPLDLKIDTSLEAAV